MHANIYVHVCVHNKKCLMETCVYMSTSLPHMHTHEYLNIILKMAWSDIWMRSSHCLSRWTLGTQARLRVICWTVMGKWEVHFFTIHYHYSYHQPHTPSENQDADAKNTRRSAWTAGKGKWSIRSDQVASNQDATLCTFTILQSSLQLRMVHIVVHSER